VRLDLPWMREPATRRVIGALTAAGAPVRFVGGCVRDALLDRIGPGTDVDIATPLPPEAVVEALKAARLRAIPTGMAHGTVTALDPASGRTFEITTLRLDVATDGRHATVAFTDDWRADAARRDFTMNALSADPDGTVHDYFGGVQDALAGRVRFVGDPARRLEEDYLRLLRFFRFHAHYGRGAPDAQALAACRSHAAGLERISGERIRVETLKLLTAADPAPTWRLMAGTGVAQRILGEPGDADRLAGLVRVEPAADPVRRLAALGTGAGAGALAVAERLRCSNAERDRLAAIAGHAGAVHPGLDRRALRRVLYRLGRDLVLDLILLALAETPGDARLRDLQAEAEAWQPVALPVKGRDAVAAGIPKGPAVGGALRAVEAWWIEQDFQPGREACLARLREAAGQGGR